MIVLPDDFRAYVKSLEQRIAILERASQGVQYRYGVSGLFPWMISASAVQNWDFEAPDISPWKVVGDPTKVRLDNTKAAHGSQSLAIDPASVPTGISQTIPVRNVSYVRSRVRWFVQSPDSVDLTIRYVFRNDKGDNLRESTTSWSSGFVDDWSVIPDKNVEVPKDTTEIEASFIISGNTQTVWLDMIQVGLNDQVWFSDVRTALAIVTPNLYQAKAESGYIWKPYPNGLQPGTYRLDPVTFQGKSFEGPPSVIITPNYGSGSPELYCLATDITSTGFTPVVFLKSSISSGIGLSWFAIYLDIR